MVTYVVLYFRVIAVHEYVDAGGRSPFADWFNSLNAPAAARVATALARIG